MKKVLPKKARILIASSLVVVFLAVVVLSVSLVFSSITYSQKLGTQFNMSYKAPDPWASVVYPQTYVGEQLNAHYEGALLNSPLMIATGKKYTIDANGTTKECLEYVYNDGTPITETTQRVVRLVGAVHYSFNNPVTWLNSTIENTSGPSVSTTPTIGNGNYWFKVEPIEFDTFTLSSGETVKISKMILGSMAFDDDSNDWSTSSLKSYLNGIFLEESGIGKVAKNRTYYSTKYSDANTLASNGTQVTSKIWLPSNGEIQEMYGTEGSSNTAIRKVATDFARATYTWVYTGTDTSCMKDINGTSESCSRPWLRSAASYSNNTVFVVDPDGYIGGMGTFSCSEGGYSFSPAFVI